MYKELHFLKKELFSWIIQKTMKLIYVTGFNQYQLLWKKGHVLKILVTDNVEHS